MRTLLIAGAFALVLSPAAFACRGTAEYPETAARLTNMNLPAAEKKALVQRLEEGEALHRRAHEENDPSLAAKSLEILDEVKAKIAP